MEQFAQKLMLATQEYAHDDRWRSWWYILTVYFSVIGMLVIATLAPWWWARAVASILAALILVRGFILYHDFMHGSILRGSRLARVIMWIFGLFLLTPPLSWRKSHNCHHANIGKTAFSHVGSFPVMSVEQWRAAGCWQRMYYRFARSALNIGLAYLTIFAFSITLEPLLRNPRRHWDSLLSIAVHGGAIVATWWFGGFWAPFFAVILPFGLASMIGAYLFYAQHNSPDIRLIPDEEWSFHRAALASSSYIRLGRILRWITGDIGFHHVHHLNAGIPFYRLKEAMVGIEAIDASAVTSLMPRDILACLRLKLWDSRANRLVGFPTDA